MQYFIKQQLPTCSWEVKTLCCEFRAVSQLGNFIRFRKAVNSDFNKNFRLKCEKKYQYLI